MGMKKTILHALIFRGNSIKLRVGETWNPWFLYKAARDDKPVTALKYINKYEGLTVFT